MGSSAINSFPPLRPSYWSSKHIIAFGFPTFGSRDSSTILYATSRNLTEAWPRPVFQNVHIPWICVLFTSA